MNQSYECGYHYTEGSIRNKKRVNDLQSWIYPNLDKILSELQEKLNDNNFPLEIEIQDKRIKISHETPEKIGKLAQIKLSPYLANIVVKYIGICSYMIA